MSHQALIRSAQRSDLASLIELEKLCFQSDRLSPRSFSHFLKSEHCDLLVMQAPQGDALIGYILLLYRRGTNLARIYSVALDPKFRGQGLSRALMQAAEERALEHRVAFLRLEVSAENRVAKQLYDSLRFHKIAELAGYYEDGSDGIRMEKRIRPAKRPGRETTYYAQTTPFSCGPASLMMAMASLTESYEPDRNEELRIWREATTIYMTSGHGGCSPVGLANSALRRGYGAQLYLGSTETPFIESVRDAKKREVIELVHQQYLNDLTELGVEPIYEPLSAEQLIAELNSGKFALCLISTWRLNRNKAPHWVVASGADQRFIYFCDPDREEEFWHSDADFIDIPIAHDQYANLSRYGKTRFSATLLLSRP